MRKIVILFSFLFSLHAQSAYELGKGMQVASLPFYVGGYISLDYRNMNNENRYRIDDLAVLGYGNYDNFSYMAEFEFNEFYVETHKSDDINIEKDYNLHTERVYLDYNLNENYMFRVGKYNSQIGFWNLLPVNVLRETTSSPISSDIIFPKFTTGGAASYSSYNESELKVDIMLQNNDDLDDTYNNYKIDKHYGFGVLYENEDYAIKANGGYFHKIDGESDIQNLYYFLLSCKYDTDNYQFQAEFGSQKSNNNIITTSYAGYMQGLYRFSEKHLGVVRLESYEDKTINETDEIAIVAYTYRPYYPVAVKSEYQFHSLREENKFLFSFSVLF